ncbi:hypothetical protein J6253_03180 [bacterium]|nr:hypothetical protein [bacterium]
MKSDLKPEELWKQESRLFGSTEKDPDSKDGKSFGRSRIELKIVDKTRVRFLEVNTVEKDDIKFGNVLNPSTGCFVEAASYLGYGVIEMKKINTPDGRPKRIAKITRKCVQPNSRLTLSIDIPSEYKEDMIQTLYYIDLFGTIGSKSKNGFGSIAVKPIGFDFKKCAPRYENIEDVMNNGKHYPNSLVLDDYGSVMIWQTGTSFDKYESAMQFLCKKYMNLKCDLKNEEYGWQNLFGTAGEGKDKLRLPSLLTLKVIKKSDREYIGLFIFTPYDVDGWENGWKDLFEAMDFLCESFGKLENDGNVKKINYWRENND